MLLAPLMRPGKLMIPPSQKPPGVYSPISVTMATHVGVFKKPRKEPKGEQTPGGIRLKERRAVWHCVALCSRTAGTNLLSAFTFGALTMFPYYPRHVAVLTETIKKGIHDADSEARSIARK